MATGSLKPRFAVLDLDQANHAAFTRHFFLARTWGFFLWDSGAACWGILPQGIILVTATCNGRPLFVTAAYLAARFS